MRVYGRFLSERKVGGLKNRDASLWIIVLEHACAKFEGPGLFAIRRFDFYPYLSGVYRNFLLHCVGLVWLM